MKIIFVAPPEWKHSDDHERLLLGFFASCPHELLMWPVSQDLNAFDSLRFDAPVLALCVDDFPLHFICLASKKKKGQF